MLYLGLDSATSMVSLALLEDEDILIELAYNARKNKNDSLIVQIDSLLGGGGVGLDQIDALVIGRGPGSYTGLRIGYAIMKTFAMTRQLPLYEWSSLQGIAERFYGTDRTICPILDARIDEIYFGCYRWTGDELSCFIDDRVGTFETLLQTAPGHTLFVGEGLKRYAERLKNATADRIIADGNQNVWPSAANAIIHVHRQIRSGLLALPELLRNSQTDEDFRFLNMIEPAYLRPSEAERKKNE